MSKMESKLDKAGMAFMLCGDKIPDDTRRRRNEIITGVEFIAGVSRTPVFVTNPDQENYSNADVKKKGQDVGDSVEGMDYIIWQSVHATLTPDGNITSTNKGIKVELKSIGSFLERYHGKKQAALNGKSGTLPFELYNKNGDAPGWLLHLYHPDKPNAINPITGSPAYEKDLYNFVKYEKPDTPQPNRQTTRVKPHYLVYLLFADKDGKYPFAAISFKWDELAERLNSFADGSFFPNWTLPDEAQQATGQWLDGHLVSGRPDSAPGKNDGFGWCWHVEMERINDLARVTMIGDEERIKARMAELAAEKQKEAEEKKQEAQKDGKNGLINFFETKKAAIPGVINDRYQWLKDHSDGRRIDT